MSQEKAQLIAPQGHFTVPGLNVAGVVTASSFSGDCTGTASSIAQGTNVVVGVMTASSFAGDVFGNAAGLSTTTAGLKLGIVTATSFAGNFTGIGSGLTGTPNIVAGLVTASQFVGNTPGLAAGISAGKNLAAGIVTATTFYGDGSNLTGAGSTAFIRQTVSCGATQIDLNNGNIIYFTKHVGTPIISIANTSTADDITFIRSLEDPPDISYSTGGVTFNGSSEYIATGANATLAPGTNDFTLEAWINPDTWGANDAFYQTDSGGVEIYATTNYIGVKPAGGSIICETTSRPALNAWTHVALSRLGSSLKLFFNGVEVASATDSTNFTASGSTFIGAGTGYYDGTVSNLRLVVGTALYAGDFYPPSAELTNITGTKLLCCQSDSSPTAAAVLSGTTLSGMESGAGAETISLSLSLGSAITWPTTTLWNGGSAPTLASANDYSLAGQVFNLITADGGTTWYGYEEVLQSNIESYSLFSMGSNSDGMSGLNQPESTRYSSPVQIPGNWSILNYAQVAAVGGGAIKNDRTLWMWGNADDGVLGQNSAGNPAKRSSPVQVGSDTTWATLSWSYRTAIATKTDGTLWAWGQNGSGQLGQNNEGAPTRRSSPVQIPGTTWPTSRQSLFNTNATNAVIKTDGTLWIWGSGTWGQLGLNQAEAQAPGRSSPTQIPGTTWSSIGGGSSWFYATKTDNTLWAWGYNNKGQLGQNNVTHYSSPVQIPGTTWNLSGVSNGKSIVSAFKTDGTLWGWGSNINGALGQNQAPAQLNSYSSPVQLSGTTWNQIAVYDDGGRLATRSDGTAWSWGYNSNGGLGQNNRTNYSSPTQIPGTNWTGQIHGTSTAFFALRSS